jgi:sphingomyelin phosphodiesterase acid-like 3
MLRALAATILLLAAMGAVLAQEPPFRPAAGQGAFLVLTDIHFDPFADRDLVPKLVAAPIGDWPRIFEAAAQKPSPFGRDTNHALLRSTLEAAAATGLAYDFVLIAGDFLAHDFEQKFEATSGGAAGYDGFVEKTMAFVAAAVQERFPQLPVIGTFGNNDSLCGDYGVSASSRLFPFLAGQWEVLKKDAVAAADFGIGGSYVLPHPTVPRQRIVVVNDIYWSAKYRNCRPAGDDPGAAMLAWLEWQLFRVAEAGERATLLFHIPPGIDGYSSAYGRGGCVAATTSFWRKADEERFAGIIERYAAVLGPAIVGHTHMDEFRVLSGGDGTPLLAMKIFPAVSPIFGNAPAFTVVAYDRADGSLRDYAVWGLRSLVGPASQPAAVPDWRLEYSFGATYGEPAFDAATAVRLASAIREKPAIREAYTRFFPGIGAGTNAIKPTNWKTFACVQTELQPAGYVACACGG